jgi:hypothetical protein
VGSYESPLSCEICPQAGMHSGRGDLDGKEGKAPEDSFHEGGSPGPNAPVSRPMNSVKKFAGGDHGKGTVNLS